jgi:hypothetical protein
MKKIVLILAVLMVAFHCKSRNGATIDFQTKTHDFGQINEEDKTASCEFLFTNSGNAPLVINRAVASCGCTTPDYPKEPIAVGASASIKVTYNTIRRPGAFHKTITVYSNDPDAPNVVLVISGNVIPKEMTPEEIYPINMQGLRLKQMHISMLDAKTGNVYTESIDMINTNKKPVNISFNKLPKHIQVTASNLTLKPNETGFLTIRYTPSLANDFGKREDSFYIVTNPKDKANSSNKISVFGSISEDFSRLSTEQRKNAPIASFSESRISFGTITRGTHKITSISLTNKGKSPLIIRKIIPEYEDIKIIPDRKDVPAGKTIKVKIDFSSDTFIGDISHRITFITNDPQNNVRNIYLSAQVKDKK